MCQFICKSACTSRTFRGLPADAWAGAAANTITEPQKGTTTVQSGPGTASSSTTAASRAAPKEQAELVPGFKEQGSYEYIYFYTTRCVRLAQHGTAPTQRTKADVCEALLCS